MSQQEYKYDANGNIKEIYNGTYSADIHQGKSVHYAYDELNQLIEENNQIFNKRYTYTYDTGGNITSKTVYSAYNGTTPEKTYAYEYNNAWSKIKGQDRMLPQSNDWINIRSLWRTCYNDNKRRQNQ